MMVFVSGIITYDYNLMYFPYQALSWCMCVEIFDRCPCHPSETQVFTYVCPVNMNLKYEFVSFSWYFFRSFQDGVCKKAGFNKSLRYIGFCGCVAVLG